MKGIAMAIALTGVIVMASPCTANQRRYKGGDAYALAKHSTGGVKVV